MDSDFGYHFLDFGFWILDFGQTFDKREKISLRLPIYREWPVVSHHNETGTIPAPAKMAVAEEILNDPYFADLDIDLSQFSEQEKSVIIGVMQKAKVRFGKNGDLDFWFEIL